MPFPVIADPVPVTVITAAWEIANPLAAVRWLRQLQGNADPPGSSFVVVSSSTTAASWAKVPSDALAVGAALANLGYTPVNRAGDLGLTGAIGWAATAQISGSPNNIFLASGQFIYWLDSAHLGTPTAIIDVVNKTFTMPGGALSAGSLVLSGSLQALIATITGAVSVGTSLTVTADIVGHGNVGIDGNVNANGNATAARLISTVATGTAPLGINSTTRVPNLNVDLLDNAHATVTATANAIPIADATGKLAAGWLPPAVAGVPTGAVVAFDTLAHLTAAGASWQRHTPADGRLLVGAGTTFGVGFAEATAYGTSWSHTHADSGHVHGAAALGVGGSTGAAAGANNQANVSTPGTAFSQTAHTHDQGTLDVTGSTDGSAATITPTAWLPPMLGVVWGIKL